MDQEGYLGEGEFSVYCAGQGLSPTICEHHAFPPLAVGATVQVRYSGEFDGDSGSGTVRPVALELFGGADDITARRPGWTRIYSEDLGVLGDFTWLEAEVPEVLEIVDVEGAGVDSVELCCGRPGEKFAGYIEPLSRGLTLMGTMGWVVELDPLDGVSVSLHGNMIQVQPSRECSPHDASVVSVVVLDPTRALSDDLEVRMVPCEDPGEEDPDTAEAPDVGDEDADDLDTSADVPDDDEPDEEDALEDEG